MCCRYIRWQNGRWQPPWCLFFPVSCHRIASKPRFLSILAALKMSLFGSKNAAYVSGGYVLVHYFSCSAFPCAIILFFLFFILFYLLFARGDSNNSRRNNYFRVAGWKTFICRPSGLRDNEELTTICLLIFITVSSSSYIAVRCSLTRQHISLIEKLP